MSSVEYNKLFDACYDDFGGTHNQEMIDQLETMMNLSLQIEDWAEMAKLDQYADVALTVSLWEDEFVCESGDLVFRQSKKEGLFVFGIMCTFFTKIGLAKSNDIFTILRTQRRMERRLEVNG